MDSYSLAHSSIPAWEEILKNEHLPPDVESRVEEIIEHLEYISGWEPSDQEVLANNSCGTPWHDGCR